MHEQNDYYGSMHNEYLYVLAFWHADTCLTLLYNPIEGNLRGMKDRKKERMTKSRAFYFQIMLRRIWNKDLKLDFLHEP